MYVCLARVQWHRCVLATPYVYSASDWSATLLKCIHFYRKTNPKNLYIPSLSLSLSSSLQSHLNKELIRLVEENKEITLLKDLNRTLDERSHRLKLEKRQLEDEKRDLVADYTGRITNLQHRLEELSHKNKQLTTENERLVHERQQGFQKAEQLTAELQSLRSSSASHS